MWTLIGGGFFVCVGVSLVLLSFAGLITVIAGVE